MLFADNRLSKRAWAEKESSPPLKRARVDTGDDEGPRSNDDLVEIYGFRTSLQYH